MPVSIGTSFTAACGPTEALAAVIGGGIIPGQGDFDVILDPEG